MSQRKLGRGLGSLLQQTRGKGKPKSAEKGAQAAKGRSAGKAAGKKPAASDSPAAVEIEKLAGSGQIVEMPLGLVQPNPYQPRLTFDPSELDALKVSIDREGVLQPVLVRPDPAGTDGYQLVAGERRFRACRELGRESVPAIVVDVPDDRLLELALIENLHREDLNPVDTAKAFQGLIEARKWTQDALAKYLGLSRPAVSNTLRLLDLPDSIQRALERGQIQVGHAKVLLSVTNPVEQKQLFDRIAEDRLTVRELQEARDDLPDPLSADAIVANAKGRQRGRNKAGRAKSPSVRALEQELTEILGTKVTIDEKRGKGKGSVKIEFYSAEDFEQIRRLLVAGAD